MKVQVATLALGERGYIQFTVTPHDDLVAELRNEGRDLRVYLRDALYRDLKRRFGPKNIPWFFFVMEDLAKDGSSLVRPHAHGSIEIRPAELPAKGMGSRKFLLMARQSGEDAARLAWGHIQIRAALKAVARAGRAKVAVSSGVDQSRNWWWSKPYGALFNHGWVDYAFKNEAAVSPELDDTRLALPYGLRREAERLWALVRNGESAMAQWL